VRGTESLAAMSGTWGFLMSTKEPVWWTPGMGSDGSGCRIAESKEE